MGPRPARTRVAQQLGDLLGRSGLVPPAGSLSQQPLSLNPWSQALLCVGDGRFTGACGERLPPRGPSRAPGGRQGGVRCAACGHETSDVEGYVPGGRHLVDDGQGAVLGAHGTGGTAVDRELVRTLTPTDRPDAVGPRPATLVIPVLEPESQEAATWLRWKPALLLIPVAYTTVSGLVARVSAGSQRRSRGWKRVARPRPERGELVTPRARPAGRESAPRT